MNESFKHIFFLFCYSTASSTESHSMELIKLKSFELVSCFTRIYDIFYWCFVKKWIVFISELILLNNIFINCLTGAMCMYFWIIYLIVLENYPLLIYFGNSCFNCVAERALRNFPSNQKQQFNSFLLQRQFSYERWVIFSFRRNGGRFSILLYYFITLFCCI